jgi:serine/threonine protein kinase
MVVGMAAGLEPEHGELYCPTCEQTFAHGERCPTDNTRLVRITTSDSLIGRELDGRYTIGEPIGHGGMGTVYRGTQHSVGREVAIKVVMPNLVANPVVIKRFLREAKLASRLAHPNAVSVLDFGQTPDGLFYLIMELVSGRTLDVVLAAEGPLPPTRVVRIGTQICDALEGAHALDIVHRDLKPQNVMVIATGRDLIKVLDFGLAKSLSPDATSATMTNAGALLGTPAYLPPELVSGGTGDARADLYSLGCVLYVAATGRPPFSAGSIHELIAMHASEPVPPIAGYPRRLAAVIEKLLAKDPAHRYPTAAAAREALDTALVAPSPPPDEPVVSSTSTVLGWTGLPIITRAARSTGTPRSQMPPRTTGLAGTADPHAPTESPGTTPSAPRSHEPTSPPELAGTARPHVPPSPSPSDTIPTTPRPDAPMSLSDTIQTPRLDEPTSLSDTIPTTPRRHAPTSPSEVPAASTPTTLPGTPRPRGPAPPASVLITPRSRGATPSTALEPRAEEAHGQASTGLDPGSDRANTSPGLAPSALHARVPTTTGLIPSPRTGVQASPRDVRTPPAGIPAQSTHGSGRGSSPVIGPPAERDSSPSMGSSELIIRIHPPAASRLVASPDVPADVAAGSTTAEPGPRSRLPLIVVGIAIVLAGAIGAFFVMKSRNATAPASVTAPHSGD